MNSMKVCFSENDLLNVQNRSRCIKKLKKIVMNRTEIRKQDKILNKFVFHNDSLTMFISVLVKKIRSGSFGGVVVFKKLVHVCVTLHRSPAQIGSDKLVNKIFAL